MSPLLLLGLACDRRTPLADEGRELGRIELSGRTFVWRASLRGWRHGWSLDPSDPHPPYDAIYLGWEVGSEGRILRGEVDQTWDLAEVEEGRRRYSALALERCASGDRLAFRVEPEAPWRILVPDQAGAGADLGEGVRCEDALEQAGPAADWRRDRTAHPALCTHLYRLGSTADAVRCLLREPVRNGTGRASRQDLGRAPDDPGFDARLLEVLGPEAAGDRSAFAPYRVRDLLGELRDRDGLLAVARQTAPAEPWQAALVAATAGEDPGRHPELLEELDRLLDSPGPAADCAAELLLSALAEHAPEEELRPRMERAARHAPIADCPPSQRPEPGRCASLGALAEGWLARHG